MTNPSGSSTSYSPPSPTYRAPSLPPNIPAPRLPTTPFTSPTSTWNPSSGSGYSLPPIPPSMTYPGSSVSFNPSSRPMTFDPKIPGLPTNPYLTMPGSSYPGSLAGAPFTPGSGQLPIPSSLTRPSSGNPASTAPSSSPLPRSFTLPSSSSAIPPSMSSSHAPFNLSNRPMTFDPKIPGLPTNPYLTMPGSSYSGSLAGVPFTPGSGQLPIPSSLARLSSGYPGSSVTSTSPLPPFFTPSSSSSSILSSWRSYKPPEFSAFPTSTFSQLAVPSPSLQSLPSSISKPFSGTPSSTISSTSPLSPSFTLSNTSSEVKPSWMSSPYKPPQPPSFTLPTTPSVITPSWTSTSYKPPQLPACYTLTPGRSTASTPSLQPLDPSSLRYPSLMLAIPSTSWGVPSYSQPPSLSGRAHVPSNLELTMPSMNHQLTVWQPPTLPQTYGSASGSFPLSNRRLAFEEPFDIQASLCRKLEQALKTSYQVWPSPKQPIASPWQTMGMPPVAIRINPQTTLFVDLFNVTELFQRVNARVQETRLNHDDPSRGADQAITILQSNEVHGTAKYVGIFVKNFLPIHIPTSTEVHATTKCVGIFVKNGLQLAEHFGYSKTRDLMNLDAMPLSQAWETKAVPAMHQAVDNIYQTNLAENFNPNNDSRVQQFVQDTLLDPLWLMPFGPIAEGMSLGARGTQVAIREITSAIKTAKVAAEMPIAMRPAYATAGNMMAKETKAIEGAGALVNGLKAGPRAANLESKAVSSAGKIAKTEETATMVGHQVTALEHSAKAQIIQLEKKVSEWLGEGTQFMRNKSGDPIFLSKDGLRKVRFDFNKPHPHQSPHLHFEHFVDGKWQELNRVYPIDVPHN